MREENKKTPIHMSDENVLAIAADYKISDVSLPIFHLDEISKIANFILKKVGLK